LEEKTQKTHSQMDPKDTEFYSWLAEINMRALKTGPAFFDANCQVNQDLLSPGKIAEHLQSHPERTTEHTALFDKFMKRLEEGIKGKPRLVPLESAFS